MKLSGSYTAFILLFFLFVTDISYGQVPEGAISAPTNIRQNDYPYILPDLRVMFRVEAPDAQKVQIDLGKLYDMERDENGAWTVTTEPQVPGFHYYFLVIDGVKVADPASESYFGTGRMTSAIDIPEAGIDFYTLKDVPHGDIRSKNYFSSTTGSWRNVNIYTPPGYDQDMKKTYPVLYIQHGGGEDERGWAIQGKTNIILDNLIAEGKAVPMIVVIPNGNATKPGVNARGYNDEAMAVFKEELFDNIMPFIEKNYRIKTDAANTALAGLSMGGGQSFFTGLRNTDKFANVGVFSTGLFGGIAEQSSFDPETIVPGILSDAKTFNEKLKLFFISVGEQDQRIEHTKKLIKTFNDNGLHVFFESYPGDHEWQVWRKSLHSFAQKLFKTIPYGTTIDPEIQISESRELAKSSVNPDSPQWQAKGDQHRSYTFTEADTTMSYRIYVPEKWDGKSKLPLVMFLHGASSNENNYPDANKQQMIKLADKYGFLLVSPLGYSKLGAYGTSLRLPAVFGRSDEAAKQMAAQTAEKWNTFSLSEKDVINVLELVLNEYPVDRSSMFLTGHSMGSGGTWYLGAKYNNYWKAIVPMSGPFVDKNLYPWDRIRNMPVLLSEGAKSVASLEGSREMAAWMKDNGFNIEYKEVNGDHEGMIPLVLPDVFKFFHDCMKK